MKRAAYGGKPSDYKMHIALSSIGSLDIGPIVMLEGETIYADFVAEHGFGLRQLGLSARATTACSSWREP